jgi:hypothetical protein
MKFRINIYILLLLLVAVACDDEPDTLPLGQEVMKSSSRLVFIDTFSIKMSTVVMDSIVTSGTELLLTGAYNDEKLGKIVSKSYFKIGYARSIPDENDVYDSVCLVLSYSGYSHGDTTVRQRIWINRLLEKLELKDQSYFYNTSGLDYEDEPVGEFFSYPKPGSRNKMTIRLDQTFGSELFDYINEAQEDEFKKSEFNDFFKGLVLVPDEMSGNSIIGYTVKDTSLCIKIYTHDINDEEDTKEIVFPVINTDLQFNQIICDWSNNTAFQNHSQKTDIPSSATGNITYVNAGLGMFTKMTFPSLPSLVELENAVLVRAVLYFKPAYGAEMNLPSADAISVYQTSKNNKLESVIAYSNGTSIKPVLSIDELYNEKTWYSINITDHMIRELSDHYIDPHKALSVSFSSVNVAKSLDQLLLGGAGNKITEPELELLFLFYDLE